MDGANKNLYLLYPKTVSFFNNSGETSDIESVVLFSNLSISRNLDGVNFPASCNNTMLNDVSNLLVSSIFKKVFLEKGICVNLLSLNELDKKLLLERWLISRKVFLEKKDVNLIVSLDEDFVVVVNDEDHLKVTGFTSGLNLEKLLVQVREKIDLIGENFKYAYDNEFGFLTSNPNLVGTSMIVGAMMSLPGLSLSGNISQIISSLSSLKFKVEGSFGEGSESIGCVYLVSNGWTLGVSENEIIERVKSIFLKIVYYEQHARQKLLEEKPSLISDFVGRAFGVLKYCRSLSERDALNYLSAIRMGVDLNMFSEIKKESINNLFIEIQEAHLRKRYPTALNSLLSVDEVRASILRKCLN